ncbi:hypothetical protein BDZ91DRAFT_744601, partial [Kalaharituber pfeilii]
MAMFSYITKFIRNLRCPLQSYSPPAHSKISRTFLPLSICLIPSAPPHFLAHALQSCRTCSQFSGPPHTIGIPVIRLSLCGISILSVPYFLRSPPALRGIAFGPRFAEVGSSDPPAFSPWLAVPYTLVLYLLLLRFRLRIV